MEIQCQIIFLKHRFWKIHELETFGTRKRILGTKLEGRSCDRKRPVVFWTFHTFVRIANQPWTATKNSSREKIQGNVWKVQNTTGRFLSQLHPSNFFLKILFLVSKVSNSWIFQKRCFMKIIWHRISIQTLLFQACLPTRESGVKNRDKTYRVGEEGLFVHVFWQDRVHAELDHKSLSICVELYYVYVCKTLCTGK